uniref:ubiquitinyl hydrolase 1 n=1 Tax=Lactuca sativa TaxID=4236 RepID=A0A9R1WCR9_LACSA|nr:hypothetical protein LSAT_V11C200087600 [Lactuca sativa]
MYVETNRLNYLYLTRMLNLDCLKFFTTKFTRYQVQNFGEPFLLIIHENETLASVKIRIQRKLEVHDDEFSMWKFAFVCMGRPEYLQDSDAVSTRFQVCS